MQRESVESAIERHIRCGATHLVLPYLHIKAGDDGWGDKQIGLYRTARAVLDRRRIALPTVAVIDLSWRLLQRRTWPEALLPLLTAIDAAGFDEIALAGSNVDGGAHPNDRAQALLGSITRAARTAPVIA